ncbi:hypothetical protein K3180_12670 [Qipengyuania sp. YG19]|nr:hypothetical protein [Qipengyuania huizhouensis]MBX7461842.1 hypothetical protein [Qipengyuania huizhouensis]
MADIEAFFERTRLDLGLTVDATPLGPCNTNEMGVQLKAASMGASPSLAEAYALYMDDPTHCWSASTRQAYETTRNLGPVDKLIGPEAGGGDMYEAEIAC